jgi:hypothetical protein
MRRKMGGQRKASVHGTGPTPDKVKKEGGQTIENL